METKTKTDNTDRELSTSEFKIAIAQIEDRLARIIKAQIEFYAKSRKLKGEDWIEKQDQLQSELLAKFEIPNEAELFDQESDEVNKFTTEDLTVLKQYISSFVKGKLTEDQIIHICFYLHEVKQYDYGWIFIERTGAFYRTQVPEPERDDLCYHTKVQEEMIAIGSRSKSKNNKLKPLFQWYKAID
jgi:hypothetical protein